MHQNLVPDPFIILVNNPKQPLHARNSFGNKILWKRIIKNSEKNLTLFNQSLLMEVWWCNIKWFLSYSKNYICKFMQANSWHHKLFHFHLSFWVWKVWKGRWKGRENITKILISREPKELLNRNKKTFFIVFEELSFGKKIKIR